MRTEELRVVEHDREDPPKPLLADERRQTLAADARSGALRQRGDRVLVARDEVLPLLQQPRKTLQQLGLDHGRGAHRQQADQRPHRSCCVLPSGIRMTS